MSPCNTSAVPSTWVAVGEVGGGADGADLPSTDRKRTTGVYIYLCNKYPKSTNSGQGGIHVSAPFNGHVLPITSCWGLYTGHVCPFMKILSPSGHCWTVCYGHKMKYMYASQVAVPFLIPSLFAMTALSLHCKRDGETYIDVGNGAGT